MQDKDSLGEDGYWGVGTEVILKGIELRPRKSIFGCKAGSTPRMEGLGSKISLGVGDLARW